MASWTNQSTSSLLPGEPWTSAKALAAFENPEAIAEGASGAPVQTAAWHGYDVLNVGDGNTGEIYSFGTDGAVATVETPNFESNFEYRLLGFNVGVASTAGSSQWNIDALIGGSWTNIATLITSGTVVTSDRFDFDCYIKSPTRSRKFVATEITAYAEWIGGSGGLSQNEFTLLSTPNSITRARVRYGSSSPNIGKGTILMLRRREY